MAVVTQSQTLSSLVQPNLTQSKLVKTNTSRPLASRSELPSQQPRPIGDALNLPQIDLNTSALLALRQRMDERVARDKNDFEAQLLKGMASFQLGDSEQAFNDFSQLSQRAPRFHLAHLLRADILASRVDSAGTIGSLGINIDQLKLQNQINGLRYEAQMRIKANLLPKNKDKVPLPLLNLSPSIKTALLVEKSSHRLYVYKRRSGNAPAKLLQDFYISTGRKTGNKVTEGDLKTPEGVYFITSWIPDRELPEKYGVGAFPMNYPNALDRKLGKTGDGIWLHGTDRIYYSRPPLDSEGCVVLSNPDLQKIKSLIRPGKTPIIIAEEIQWVSVEEWNRIRSQVLKSIERWRLDWESLNVKRYLSHYGKDFWSGGHNKRSWQQYKTRVSRQKTYQKVTLSDLSLFYYPGKPDEEKRVLARFTQKYRSNNYNGEINKRIYLSEKSGLWRIVYEGR